MKRFGFCLLSVSLYSSLASAAEGKEKCATNTEPVAQTKLTREYLLAHGFKQYGTDRDAFVAEHVRLGDVASTLGFEIGSLRATLNQSSWSDVRTAIVEGKPLVVRSEVRDANGRIVRESLDRPDAVCTVHVSLKKCEPPKRPLATDGTPRLRIRSVALPPDRKKPLEISCELATDGKTPLAVSQGHLAVCVFDGDKRVFEGRPAFSEETAKMIVVQPRKPRMLTITSFENSLTGSPWSDLRPGKYILRIVISGAGQMKPPHSDYQWLSSGSLPFPWETSSDGYTLTIKPRSENR